MLSDLIRQSFHTEEPCVIFLCRDNDFRLGHGSEHLVDPLDVFPLEAMMVGVGEWCDVLGVWLEVDDDLLGRGNASEQQDILIGLNVADGSVFTEIERFQLIVFQGCEVQFLIGEKIHGTCEHSEFHGLEVSRAFRHDHDVCTVLPLLRFPKSSGRQQLVIDNQTVVVN